MFAKIFKIIFVLLIVNQSLQLFAQKNNKGIIYGKIIDKQTGDGLIGAKIYIYNSAIFVVSDKEGEFKLEVAVGEQILNVVYAGYDGYTKEIVVEPNDILQYEISISPLDISEITGSLKSIDSYINFSLDLFGTWEPVEGKFKRKKIKQFNKGTEVVFDWRKYANKKIVGAISYTDDVWCTNSRTKFTYKYVDKDSISFKRINISEKARCDENEFWIGTFFNSLIYSNSKFFFNETKNVLTIKNDKHYKRYLVLKRKEINNETGVIKGKIIDKQTGDGLIGANIFIDNYGSKFASTSDTDGNFMLKAPTGNHVLKRSYIGYENYTKEITVEPNDTLTIEIALEPTNYSCPWESSTPYPELNGNWKLKYYKKGFRRIFLSKRKRKSTMSFQLSDEHSPGSFSYSDGCNGCGSICFRHIEDGNIEFQKNGMLLCTLIGCYKKYEIGAFVSKMRKNKTKTIVKNNGKILKLIVGKEKLVLKKAKPNS